MTLEDVIALVEELPSNWSWLLKKDRDGYFANIYRNDVKPAEVIIERQIGTGITPLLALQRAYYDWCTKNKE